MNSWTSSFDRGRVRRGLVEEQERRLVSSALAIRDLLLHAAAHLLIAGPRDRFQHGDVRGSCRPSSLRRDVEAYNRQQREFSIGLSFLKKAASTLTLLIRRLTFNSSRSTFGEDLDPPASSVRRPAMRR